jgi:hypothetical protein
MLEDIFYEQNGLKNMGSTTNVNATILSGKNLKVTTPGR